MPAYAKVSLVTPVFHASDIAFVRGWSAAAPGFGGWRVTLDRDELPEQVSVTPPGSEEAVFLITKEPRDVVLFRRRRGSDEPAEVQRFVTLREAVLGLCALTDDALEEIQEGLEMEFPRVDR